MNYALQGHPAGPEFPSAEAGSSIVEVVEVDVSMEGTFEKIVRAEREAVSHDIVVRVLVTFLLAQLRKMGMDNQRLCRGSVRRPYFAWIPYGVYGGCSQLLYHRLNMLCMDVQCIRSSS
jgi:hypothetical protein